MPHFHLNENFSDKQDYTDILDAALLACTLHSFILARVNLCCDLHKLAWCGSTSSALKGSLTIAEAVAASLHSHLVYVFFPTIPSDRPYKHNVKAAINFSLVIALTEEASPVRSMHAGPA